MTHLRPGRWNRIALGIFAGAIVVITAMLIVAGLALGAGWIEHDLTRWLVLESTAGGVACGGAGFVCRRIARSWRGPVGLAYLVSSVGTWEAVEVLRHLAATGSAAPAWLAIFVPVSGALGVLVGGTRRTDWSAAWAVVRRVDRARLLTPVAILVTSAAIAVWAVPSLAGGDDQRIVAAAISLDLAVAWPAAVFWFWARARRAMWFTMIPALAAGYAIASATIPAHHRGILEAVRWFVVVVEAGLVTYLGVVAFRAVRDARDADVPTRVRAAALRLFGARLPADILTTELSIGYYAVAGGRRPGFTVHREASYATIAIVIGLAIIVETVALHALVATWSSVAAWCLTGLSLYAVLWLVGDYRACASRPIQIDRTHLRLRIGIRWEADIPLASLREIGPLGATLPSTTAALKLSMLGQPNVRLRLAHPVEVRGMYGIRRSSNELWVRVDRHLELCRELASSLGGTERSRAGHGEADERDRLDS